MDRIGGCPRPNERGRLPDDTGADVALLGVHSSPRAVRSLRSLIDRSALALRPAGVGDVLVVHARRSPTARGRRRELEEPVPTRRGLEPGALEPVELRRRMRWAAARRGRRGARRARASTRRWPILTAGGSSRSAPAVALVGDGAVDAASLTTSRPASSAGRTTSSMCWARSAANSNASALSVISLLAGSARIARTSFPVGVPPCSKVSTASSSTASRRACVDLPEPSLPSKAM